MGRGIRVQLACLPAADQFTQVIAKTSAAGLEAGGHSFVGGLFFEVRIIIGAEQGAGLGQWLLF